MEATQKTDTEMESWIHTPVNLFWFFSTLFVFAVFGSSSLVMNFFLFAYFCLVTPQIYNINWTIYGTSTHAREIYFASALEQQNEEKSGGLVKRKYIFLVFFDFYGSIWYCLTRSSHHREEKLLRNAKSGRRRSGEGERKTPNKTLKI